MNKLKLSPGMKVLDIGCGTGGSAFYMAKHYGVEVLGVDLSQNMLDIANEHKLELFDKKVMLLFFNLLKSNMFYKYWFLYSFQLSKCYIFLFRYNIM